jgi:hypothetical protein
MWLISSPKRTEALRDLEDHDTSPLWLTALVATCLLPIKAS